MIVDVLGVPITRLTKAGLIEQVIEWCCDGECRTVAYANAHSLNLAQDNAHYLDALKRADLVYSDGIGAAWAARWLSSLKFEKITGHDWIDDLCRSAAERNKKICLLGGQPGVANQAASKLVAKYPKLEIVAARDGFTELDAESGILDEINHLAPHILLVGMGAPRQELWVDRHRAELSVPVCWSVGALFDLVAGIEPVVPSWMNALALEWMWRLLADPSGKWRRYILGNPRFIWRVLIQKVQQG